MKKKQHIYELNDTLSFGKYRGKSIHYIITHCPEYLLWCVKEVENFLMSDAAWDYACQMHKDFETIRPCTCDITNLIEGKTVEGYEILAHYPWKNKEKVRSKYLDFARKNAEDIVIYVENNNGLPIQLTLF